MYINKKKQNKTKKKKSSFGSKIYILGPLPQIIYKLTQEIQKMDNKKNLLKKCTYPNIKKNLWTNHKFSLSKSNNNNSITNPSKKNHKNSLTFT